MKTVLIDIIDPKAQKLLEDLAEMDLIAFKNEDEPLPLTELLKSLQEEGERSGLSETDMLSEVKSVYAGKRA